MSATQMQSVNYSGRCRSNPDADIDEMVAVDPLLTVGIAPAGEFLWDLSLAVCCITSAGKP